MYVYTVSSNDDLEFRSDIALAAHLTSLDKMDLSNICEITEMFFEPGREYAVLRGILKRGVSKSDKQVVYWPLNELDRLEIVKGL